LSQRDRTEVQLRGHAGCGIDEPGTEMQQSMFGVALFGGEQVSGGQCGYGKAQGEEGIAVRGEGRLGCSRRFGVCVRRRFGEIVAGCAWAARRGE